MYVYTIGYELQMYLPMIYRQVMHREISSADKRLLDVHKLRSVFGNKYL